MIHPLYISAVKYDPSKFKVLICAHVEQHLRLILLTPFKKIKS